MWVNRKYFESMVTRVELQEGEIRLHREQLVALETENKMLMAQKVKDDITTDWMRHRVNELTKQNAVLLQKAAGVNVPVPEIVPVRPGTMTVPDFSSMPSFEDVGDEEAQRLGIKHTEDGVAEYTK